VRSSLCVCSAIFELPNPLPHSTFSHYSWSLNTTQLPMNFGCSKIFAFKNHMTKWIWQLAEFSIKLFISNWCNTKTHNNRRLKLWCLAGFIMNYLNPFCMRTSNHDSHGCCACSARTFSMHLEVILKFWIEVSHLRVRSILSFRLVTCGSFVLSKWCG